MAELVLLHVCLLLFYHVHACFLFHNTHYLLTCRTRLGLLFDARSPVSSSNSACRPLASTLSPRSLVSSMHVCKKASKQVGSEEVGNCHMFNM